MAADVLSTSLSSASSLVALQLLSRLATFALNQALVRLVSPHVFGTASIQLELLLSTILFLSREGVRGTILRSGIGSAEGSNGGRRNGAVPEAGKEDGGLQAALNLASLPVFFGAAISLVASVSYYVFSSSPTRSQPHFFSAVLLYTIAALLELVPEPLYMRAQLEHQFGLRVSAEGSAVVAKSIVTLAVILAGGEQAGLLAFAVGQAVYASVLLVRYWWHYSRPGSPENDQRPALMLFLHPIRRKKDASSSYFDPVQLQLAWTMVKQSFLKHFLTEGDKFAVSRIGTLSDQGGYALASNYGSLVARILFQPMEESARLIFSQTLGNVKTVEADAQRAPDHSRPKEDGSSPTDPAISQSNNTSDKSAALALLTSMLTFHTHFALLFLFLAPPYTRSLIHLLAGSRWSSGKDASAPRVLAAYCAYVPVMGVNGITEAFLQATGNKAELTRFSRAMVGFSAVFVLAVAVFVKGLGWRETGLIWANVVNLACRSTYCLDYTVRFFRRSQVIDKTPRVAIDSSAEPNPSEHGARTAGATASVFRLPTVLPAWQIVLSFLLGHFIVLWSEGRFVPAGGVPTLRGVAQHVAVGAAVAVTCSGVIVVFSRQTVSRLLAALRRRKSE